MFKMVKEPDKCSLPGVGQTQIPLLWTSAGDSFYSTLQMFADVFVCSQTRQHRTSITAEAADYIALLLIYFFVCEILDQ